MFRHVKRFHSIADFIELKPHDANCDHEYNMAPVECGLNYEAKMKFINDYEIYMSLPIDNDIELENLTSMLNFDVVSYSKKLREEEISHFNKRFFDKVYKCMSSQNLYLVMYTIQLLDNITIYFFEYNQVMDFFDQQFVDAAINIPKKYPSLAKYALIFLYNLFFSSPIHFELSFPVYKELIELTKNMNDKDLIQKSINFVHLLVKNTTNKIEIPSKFLSDYITWEINHDILCVHFNEQKCSTCCKLNDAQSLGQIILSVSDEIVKTIPVEVISKFLNTLETKELLQSEMISQLRSKLGQEAA